MPSLLDVALFIEICALIAAMCACRTFETYAQDLVHAAALKRRRRKSCCLPRLRKRNLKVGMQHAFDNCQFQCFYCDHARQTTSWLSG
jgi:hypothetical protein